MTIHRILQPAGFGGAMTLERYFELTMFGGEWLHAAQRGIWLKFVFDGVTDTPPKNVDN